MANAPFFPDSNAFLLACIVVPFILCAILIQFNKQSDPYGLFHLSLNKLPGEPCHLPPKTEWLNMGYWKDTKSFPHACRALALKLISASQLVSGGNVLDVGVGTGESLLLLLSDPSIPRPSRLIGITSLPLHSERARNRVANLQSGEMQDKVKVDMFTADAVSDGLAERHPLHPSFAIQFDTILALDCAYHFHTRREFLLQSFRKLNSEGRIALADVCVASSAPTFKTRVITSVVRFIPGCNRVTAQEYVAQMQRIGFKDVILEDITDDVFPGFVEFLKGKAWNWWLFGTFFEWYHITTGVQFVIVSASKLKRED